MSHAPACGACCLPCGATADAATGVPGWVGKGGCPAHAQGVRTLGVDSGRIAGASRIVARGVGKWGGRRIRWHGRLAAHRRLGDHGLAGHRRRRESSGSGVGSGPRLAHRWRTARSRRLRRARGKVGAVDAHDAPRVARNCRWSLADPFQSDPPTDKILQHTVCRVEAAALRSPRCRSGDVDDGAVDELDVEHQPPTEHRARGRAHAMTVGSGVGVGVGVGRRSASA